MKHSYFEVTNYKGIEKVRLDFDAHPKGRVYTLVGLNESGKTTILEAMAFFETRIRDVDPINLPGFSVQDIHQLIPRSMRGNFNGAITIEAGYTLEDDDKRQILDFLSDDLGFEVLEAIEDDFRVEQVFEFQDSRIEDDDPGPVYHFDVYGKTKRSKNAKWLDGEKWQTFISFLKTLMPTIHYFPNFLFEFPDRIYLENPPKDVGLHRFYRGVLEDVLHAVDKTASLKKHVIARIMKEESLVDWMLGESLDNILLKMATHISHVVFTEWDKIFENENPSRKEIVIRPFREDFDEDGVANSRVYLQIRLKEGSENCSISERSLGFRWFFAFLLFTQYRGFRGGNKNNELLFLFDEPASNLHSSAQTQLLENFAKFPANSSLMYATHSHHLINPLWLEGTYVVKNSAVAYNPNEAYVGTANTKITLHKYREFVAHHPDQTTYFQPILDVLDYRPSLLEKIPDVVMLEGKNDYYTLKFMKDTVIKGKPVLHLMPGGGGGSLDHNIQLYLAWGKNFIVILDGDEEGIDQKQRYENKFGRLVENRIFALSDIDSKWKGGAMESLFTEAERTKIQKAAYPDILKYNKKHFNRAVQEAFLTNTPPVLSKGTVSRFEKVIKFCNNQLKGDSTA